MTKPQRALELVVSAAFLAVFGFTLHANWKLRQALADTTAALHAKGPAPAAFAPGDRLPELDAKDAAGQTVPMGRPAPANARETYLVVIDPACATCLRAVEEVNASRRDDINVVALQRPGNVTPIPRIRDGVPVVAVLRDSAPQFSRRIGAVPRILRIAPTGEIRAVCASLAECT